jgi:hypothetical protein
MLPWEGSERVPCAPPLRQPFGRRRVTVHHARATPDVGWSGWRTPRVVSRRVRVYVCRRETPGTRPFLPSFPSEVCGWRRSGTNGGRAGCKMHGKQASVPSPVRRGTVPVRKAAVIQVADMGSARRQEAAPTTG